MLLTRTRPVHARIGRLSAPLSHRHRAQEETPPRCPFAHSLCPLPPPPPSRQPRSHRHIPATPRTARAPPSEVPLASTTRPATPTSTPNQPTPRANAPP